MKYATPDYIETNNIVKIIKQSVKENLEEAIKAQDGKLPDVVFELLKF